jgi:hypothetical protein
MSISGGLRGSVKFRKFLDSLPVYYILKMNEQGWNLREMSKIVKEDIMM